MKSSHTLYGIIGNPLTHSLSPIMHNTAFKELDVDARYELFPIEEDELGAFFEGLKQDDCSIFGFNVTVPYKEMVIPYMDKLTPFVERVGAVNTVVVNNKRELIGYNTDAPGFMTHLAELQVETADKNVVILGAGGSARAILATLCMIPERPNMIRLYNRTGSRAEALVQDLQSRIDLSNVVIENSLDDLNLRNSDILINTTSVGLKPDDPCLVFDDMLHPDLFVYDLIYNPRETLLLRMAREQGARTANGLGMLFFQGVLALQHWAEMEIDESIKMKMREKLEEAIA